MSTNYSRHKWIAKHSTGWTVSIKFTRAASIVGLLMLTSCTETFMKSKAVNQRALTADLAATADSAGNYSATIDPNSNATQRFKAGAGSVYGAAIALPVGALSIPISITIGEGESLTSSTQQIGLSSDNPATAASSSVSFVPSSAVEAANPFTLSIPISVTTSLGLAEASSNENLVVLYKWMAVKNGATTYEIGLIPRKDITMASGTAQFQTTKFGTFQLVRTAVKVEEKIKKPTDEPPILKADAGNPLVGSWGSCENTGSQSQSPSQSNNAQVFTPSIPNVETSCLLPNGETNVRLNLQYSAGSLGAYGSSNVEITRTNSSNTATVTLSAAKQDIGTSITKLVVPIPDAATTSKLSMNEIIKIKLPTGCGFKQGTSIKQEGYFTNKLTSVTNTGITANANDTITLKNHGFSVGDLLKLDMMQSVPPINSTDIVNVLSALTSDTLTVSTNFNNSAITFNGIYPIRFRKVGTSKSIGLPSGPTIIISGNYFKVGQIVYFSTDAAGVGTAHNPFRIKTVSPNFSIIVEDLAGTPNEISFAGGSTNIYSFNEVSVSNSGGNTFTSADPAFYNDEPVYVSRNKPWNMDSNQIYYIKNITAGNPTNFQIHTAPTGGTVIANSGTAAQPINFYLHRAATSFDPSTGYASTPNLNTIATDLPFRFDFLNSNNLISVDMIPFSLNSGLGKMQFRSTSGSGAAFSSGTGSAGPAIIRPGQCFEDDKMSMSVVCGVTYTSDTPPSGDNNNQNSDGKRSLGVGPGISPKSESDFVKFSPNTFIHGNASYLGENCTGGLISRTEETGTYSLGAKNADSTQAITINMMTQKAAIFPQQAVNNANSMPKTAGCGASDWTAAQPKDLNTTECKETQDQSSNHVPKAFRIKEGKLNFPEEDGSYKPSKELKRAQ